MAIPFLDFGGDGPLLHLAHANAYSPGCYRQFAAALTAQYHVVAMQQRPLWPGQSAAELTDWHIFNQDLIRFCDEQGLRGLVGVGHSLGAVATMFSALERPELFDALVLIEPVFLEPEILDAIRAKPEVMLTSRRVERTARRRDEWPSRAEAFKHFRPKPVFSRLSDQALRDYIDAGLRERDEGGVVLAFPREWEAAIYSQVPTDVWEAVPQIQQPTLAVRAAESDTLSPLSWAKWQDLQPDATFVEMKDVGHLLPFERPTRLAEVVLAYLE